MFKLAAWATAAALAVILADMWMGFLGDGPIRMILQWTVIAGAAFLAIRALRLLPAVTG